MPAYVVLDIEVTHTEAFATYRELGPPTVAAYGSRYLVRGGSVETLEGILAPLAPRHPRISDCGVGPRLVGFG
jgi:uncharacterized protein (DUF1330 family)